MTRAIAFALLSLVSISLARADLLPRAGTCAAKPGGEGAACCWPGQSWSRFLDVCVGKPICPDGMVTRGEHCDEACTSGRVVTDDTDGHCCWPSQVWSRARNACIGVPRCAPPLSVHGESCGPGCPPGETITTDTAGRCCWPRQVWSRSEARCRGIPYCPRGYVGRGESCAATVEPTRDPAEYIPVPSHAIVHISDSQPNPDQLIEVLDSRSHTHDCDLPCTLKLPLGVTRVRASGTLAFERRLVVVEPLSLTLTHSSCGKRCAAGGFAGLFMGAVVAAAGAVVAFEGADVYNGQLGPNGGWGIAMVVTGILHVALGGVLLGFSSGDGMDLAPGDEQ